MCLVLFGYKISMEYPLVLAANRDEFFHRPTKPMDYWENQPGLLAGKDLEQGGTWFGVNKKNGRIAALTNYRDPAAINTRAPSRGELIPKFLDSQTTVNSFQRFVVKDAGRYNGYNLIFGSMNRLFCFCNVTGRLEKIEPGIHGLSNRFLNSAWPKVEKGKKQLKRIMETGISESGLFQMLSDDRPSPDSTLPDTGIGLEWERLLSALFIKSATYGTRSSTVLLVNRNGDVRITERSYHHGETGKAFSDRRFVFNAGKTS